MALSFCSNWATLQQLTPEMSNFQLQQAELARQVLGLYDNTFVDPLFDPDEFLYMDMDNYASLPYYSPPSNPLVSLSTELFPTYDFDYCDYPKRQKSFEDFYYPDFAPNCFDGYGLNSCPVPDFLPEMAFPLTQVPLTQVPNALVYSNGSSDNMKPNGGGSSAQSVAARQRRRKITEKTQELSKLIPGGNKLNTAEMFQAAFKYVKYLQAQMGILQFMRSIQEGKDVSNVEGLAILKSPRIQEKLYSEEMCLVPKGFIETLGKDEGIKSNPLIVKALNKLVKSEC